MASGGVIKILVAFGVTREPMFHYYSIYGTEGVLETSRPPVSPLQTNAYLASVPHLRNMIEFPITENVTDAPAAATQGGHGTAEYTMVQDFVACIRDDSPPPLDIHAALRMALPGLCAHESALKGRADGGDSGLGGMRREKRVLCQHCPPSGCKFPLAK